MSRHFRPWTIDQTQLLPAAVVDYVPADHLAQFVVVLTREQLDLLEIVASYKSGLGHRLEGQEVIAVFENCADPKPSYIMWLEWRDGQITYIHDYRYVGFDVDRATAGGS
jgi:hypothetical protein